MYLISEFFSVPFPPHVRSMGSRWGSRRGFDGGLDGGYGRGDGGSTVKRGGMGEGGPATAVQTRVNH